jgi:hypothetical protein
MRAPELFGVSPVNSGKALRLTLTHDVDDRISVSACNAGDPKSLIAISYMYCRVLKPSLKAILSSFYKTIIASNMT